MRRVIVLASLTLVLGTSAQRVEAGCATDLGDCYQRAAGIDNFWERWAAGLQCELDFVECARAALIGD